MFEKFLKVIKLFANEDFDADRDSSWGSKRAVD
ncbi:hypothetical protein BH09VER1_BH09VER1_04210 [soil metagenome]